jgi:hypothetical protein
MSCPLLILWWFGIPIWVVGSARISLFRVYAVRWTNWKSFKYCNGKHFSKLTLQYSAFGNPLSEASFSFLSNDENVTVVVLWEERQMTYVLPPFSVTLINGSGVELYNTAKVRSVPKYNKTIILVPVHSFWILNFGTSTYKKILTEDLSQKMNWRFWPDTNRTVSLTVSNPTPIEQLLLTFDKTDYLYYRYIPKLCFLKFLQWKRAMNMHWQPSSPNRTVFTVSQQGTHLLNVTTRRGNSLVWNTNQTKQIYNFVFDTHFSCFEIVFVDQKYQTQQYDLFSEIPEKTINVTSNNEWCYHQIILLDFGDCQLFVPLSRKLIISFWCDVIDQYLWRYHRLELMFLKYSVCLLDFSKKSTTRHMQKKESLETCFLTIKT